MMLGKSKKPFPQMVVQHGDESYIGQSVKALMFSHFIDRQTSKNNQDTALTVSCLPRLGKDDVNESGFFFQ